MHEELIGQTKFTFRMLGPQEPLEPIFRLRYQVYSEESHIVKPQEFPDGLIKDQHDPYALHFTGEDQEGMVAAARLILDSPRGFPLEKQFIDKLDIKPDDLNHQRLAELSLLVISKRYRRRKYDGLYYAPDSEYLKLGPEGEELKRIRPMAFGLYREIYQECKRLGITHYYAVMEEYLYTLLRMHNFVFHAVGKTVVIYVPVQPYFANIQESEYKINQKMPKLMEYLLDGLEPQYHPRFPSEANGA